MGRREKLSRHYAFVIVIGQPYETHPEAGVVDENALSITNGRGNAGDLVD